MCVTPGCNMKYIEEYCYCFLRMGYWCITGYPTPLSILSTYLKVHTNPFIHLGEERQCESEEHHSRTPWLEPRPLDLESNRLIIRPLYFPYFTECFTLSCCLYARCSWWDLGEQQGCRLTKIYHFEYRARSSKE